MKIKNARFITSAYSKKDYPEENIPEIAFAGKSNVGKSSLINALLNRKKLAKTSSTPGKTACLNFYSISFDNNETCQLVDLPGYGFAKRSKSILASWKNMVEEYLSSRESLKAVVLLIDIRQGSVGDLQLRDWLQAASIPTIFVATKADKLPFQKKMASKRDIINRLSINQENEAIILFSSKDGDGREELTQKMVQLLKAQNKHAF